MWGYIQAIIVSIILILIIHYLFYYIRDTFTTKKTKDLVEIQTKKYKSIVEELMAVKRHPSVAEASDVPFFDAPFSDAVSEAETVVDYDSMGADLQKFAAGL